jgi:hypothetical protein
LRHDPNGDDVEPSSSGTTDSARAADESTYREGSTLRGAVQPAVPAVDTDEALVLSFTNSWYEDEPRI